MNHKFVFSPQQVIQVISKNDPLSKGLSRSTTLTYADLREFLRCVDSWITTHDSESGETTEYVYDYMTGRGSNINGVTVDMPQNVALKFKLSFF